MFDFGVLTVPALALAGFLGYSIATGSPIVIEPIDVPGSFQSQGFSPNVVADHLADEIARIEKVADSSLRSIDTGVHPFEQQIEGIGQRFDVAWIADAIRYSAGWVPHLFSGEVVLNGDTAEMRLRAFLQDGIARNILVTGPANDPQGLIRKAAYEAALIMDPYLVALYTRRLEEKEGNFDFPRFYEILPVAFTNAAPADMPYMYSLWAATLLRQGKPEPALNLIDQALATYPRFAAFHLQRGRILAALDRNAEAVDDFRAALQLDPNLREVHQSWATVAEKQGDLEQAVTLMRRETVLHPEIAEYHGQLGQLLLKVGRREQGLASMRQAMALERNKTIYFEAYRAALNAP